MRRAAAAAVCATLVAVAAAWVIVDLRRDDSDSAFAAGSTSALPGLAAAAGMDAERMAGDPAALAHDPAAAPAGTVLAVVHPQRSYSAADRQAVEGFVAAGGLLLVADDRGGANSLVAGFGVTFERVRLVETDATWEWKIDGAGVAPGLDLPRPTALLVPPGSAATVLAASSPQSFLDRDGDGLVGEGDAVGPFAVAARIDHGAGHVILVADPNSLQGSSALADRAWWQQQIAVAGARSLMVIDEGGMDEDPGVTALAALRSAAGSAGTRMALGALAAGALAAVLLTQSWDAWGDHVHRPLRFIRRSELAGREPWRPRDQWTARGGLAFAAAASLALLWALTGSTEAGLAAGALLVALGVAFLAQVPALVASRSLATDRVLEGTRLDVDLAVRRRFGHGEVELRDRLPPEVEVAEGSPWVRTNPGTGIKLSYAVVPSVRGPQPIGPLVARRQDLLGLRVAEGQFADASIVQVAPRAQPIRRIPFGTRVPTVTLGPHLVNRAGDGTEFHALRAYQAGDPFRSVNWKASARSRDLMVNQRVHESMTRLVVLLDARAVAGAGPAARTPFTRSCRAVLSVASGVLRLRDRVRVVAYGDGVQELPIRPAVQQLHELTDFLASAAPAGQTTLAEAVDSILPTLRPGCPVLVVSGFEDDPGAPDALGGLRARGLQPWVLSPPPMTSPVDPQDGGSDAGEGRILAQRTETLARIHAAGVRVFEVASEVPLDDIFLLGGAA